MSTAATPLAEQPASATTSARAAVIGAGLMGHGIAQVLAGAGVEVRVYDLDEAARESVRERVADNLRSLGGDPAIVRRIAPAQSLADAARDADWVFEAVAEKLELKQELFRALDDAAPAAAVLATNTSVMSVTEIASRASGRHRIVGTHWWNPPYLMPLVEVVQTAETDPAVVAATISFLTGLGKTAVHVKRDVPGFVGNRLQHALWREAFNLIDAGVCDPETVDAVIRAGFGMRLGVMGPIETADLIGLDLTLDIHEYILPRLDPPSAPAPGLRARVAQGRLGMKSGEGYESWTPERARERREHLRRELARITGAARS